MADFINTIDVVGDDVLTDSIIQKTITEYKDNIVTSIGQHAFYGCNNLTVIDLPVVTSINFYALQNCITLKKADFSSLAIINNYAFYNCSNLTILILRSSNVCALGGAYALENTQIKSGKGYIYVPRALLSDDDAAKDYRRASNWANFSTRFRALEDYTVDGTITGELDPNKI